MIATKDTKHIILHTSNFKKDICHAGTVDKHSLATGQLSESAKQTLWLEWMSSIHSTWYSKILEVRPMTLLRCCFHFSIKNSVHTKTMPLSPKITELSKFPRSLPQSRRCVVDWTWLSNSASVNCTESAVQ